MQQLSNIFEVIMLVSLGISWPVSIIKSFKARTNNGKSVMYLILVLVGYCFGIMSKLNYETFQYVVILYILNAAMICIDISLYYRNYRIDLSKKEALKEAYNRNKNLDEAQ